MKTPTNFDSKLARARLLTAKGLYDEAETIYIELLEYDSVREGLLRELVQLSLTARRPEKALEYCELLVQLVPDNLDYALSGANLSEQVGRTETAIQFYQKVLGRNPDLPNTQYNLARLLKMVGKQREAIDVYRSALKCGIASPEEVYSNLAVIYSELHKEQEAFSCLRRALAINPAYIPALFNLAGLYEELGQKKEAFDCYKKLLLQYPGYCPALCRLAYMGMEGKERDHLVEEIRRALNGRTLSKDIKEELYFALGKVLDDGGHFDEAFESYMHANELGEDRFPPYNKDSHAERIRNIMDNFRGDFSVRLARSPEVMPIFICGMFRSGSTLAEQILAGHSRVTAGGELDYFPKQAEKLGLDRRGPVADLDESFLSHIAAGYNEYLSSRFSAFDLVTDKRPDNFLNLGLIKAVFPWSKVIWTRRSLLDNCLSIYFQYLGGDMNYSVSLDAIGHYYSEQVKLMEFWRSKFPDSIYELHYEALVASPESEVCSLLNFLGLEWEKGCLDFQARPNFVKTASVWQVRRSIDKGGLERCRNYEEHLGALHKYLP
ncbi:tetratricopeptide repeat-containing sulfotransferase family protein [Microbulbifer taiwanensis]|uniref:Tetratricopeptide repeat-containing sulfotransferase family protein n=1 Tax=Microbulbifer taiwanensis TaxID=986746 RepID=A0ABW1YTP9_9GAMM|nr:tetratricopeptide repeat-containing sulfotransferase family protein [Microbulbifer taiwanensis]